MHVVSLALLLRVEILVVLEHLKRQSHLVVVWGNLTPAIEGWEASSRGSEENVGRPVAEAGTPPPRRSNMASAVVCPYQIGILLGYCGSNYNGRRRLGPPISHSTWRNINNSQSVHCLMH